MLDLIHKDFLFVPFELYEEHQVLQNQLQILMLKVHAKEKK